MELNARQIELLAQIKEYGPGTPEAIAAYEAYEDERREQEGKADRDRRLLNVEHENAEIRRDLNMLSAAKRGAL